MNASARLLLAAAALTLVTCGDDVPVRRRSPDVAPGAGGATRGVPEGCVVDAGGEVTHRVEAGETLSEIARRYYGDATLWRELAAANREVVRAEGRVHVGDVLVIPFDGR